jgi:hypothetical protein
VRWAFISAEGQTEDGGGLVPYQMRAGKANLAIEKHLVWVESTHLRVNLEMVKWPGRSKCFSGGGCFVVVLG